MSQNFAIPSDVLRLYDSPDTITVYPPRESVFRAFTFFPINETRVLIVGQDVYHQEGQADGLAFSVPTGTRVPPSLVAIFKEIQRTVNPSINIKDGNLDRWARQGVLLLNRSLTVQHGKPNSHKKYWHAYTENIIQDIANQCSPLVVMLWGNEARALRSIFDLERHLVLEWTHPSPLSRVSFACDHFNKANEYLAQHGLAPIDW